MKIAHSAFIDLENALGNRVGNQWKALFHPIGQELRQAIHSKNWARANKLVDTINTDVLVEHQAQYAQTIAVSALLLGASRISSLKDSRVAQTPPAHQIRNGVAQWGYVVAKNAAQNVKLSLHLMLARLEHKAEQARHTITKFDPNEARDDHGRWTSGAAHPLSSNRELGKARIAVLRGAQKALREAHPDGGYTDKEAEAFIDRGLEIESLRYDLKLNGDAKGMTALPEDTLSALTPETNAVIVADDRRDKSLYMHMESAVLGTFINSDTPVDDILDGKNPTISAKQFYDNFAPTREALKAQFGDTLTLYRSPTMQKDKAFTNWVTTEAFAKLYGDKVVSKQVPVVNIVGAWASPNGKYHELLVGSQPGAVKKYHHKPDLVDIVKSSDERGRLVYAAVTKDEFGEQIDELNLDNEEIQTLIEKIQVDGVDYMSLAANLMVSRLSSFGFLLEAQYQGIETYEISAILDDHTCPVCEALDGQVFSLQDGIAQAKSIMDAEDADSLRSISPWPSQSKASVATLQNSSAQDLVSGGLSLPPYHAGCRCIAVAAVDDQSATADAVESLAETELPRVSEDEIAYILGLAGVAALPPILFGDEDDEEDWETTDEDEDPDDETVDDVPEEAAPKKKKRKPPPEG